MKSLAPTAVASVKVSLATERTTPLPEPARVRPGKKFRPLDLLEKPIEWLIRFCGWSSIIAIVAIFLFTFKEAAPMVL
jgi:hypothetical protein